MKTSKKIIGTFCIALLLVLLKSTSYAQQNDTPALIQKAEASGIESSVLVELQSRVETKSINDQQFRQIIISAIEISEQRLPADMVIQKVLEGLSKGISGDRIIPVVNHIQQSMEKAVGVIDPWINRAEVQQMIDRTGGDMTQERFRNEMAKATSKSIIQNISPEKVGSVLSQISNGSLLANTTPIDVIVAVGILPVISDEPGASATFVVRALKEGFKANELKKLPAALRTAQLRSQLPVASVIEGVARQMQGNIPAKRILQNLFNGNVGGGPPGNIPKGVNNKPDRGNGSD